MPRWRPDICSGGRCAMVWRSGDMWMPDPPWGFESVCAEHAKYPDDASRLAALKTENQAMSYARAKLAEILSIPEHASIEFEFDAQRRLLLSVPLEYQAVLAAHAVEIRQEFAKISTNVDVR